MRSVHRHHDRRRAGPEPGGAGDLPRAAGRRCRAAVPVGIALVTNGYPEDRRARALGLTFALANIGTALGPFVGGGMAQGPGWRWIFWLLVPFSTAAALVALRYVPESRDESASRRVDLPGAAIVAAGVAAISFGVDRANSSGWSSASTIALLAGGVALLCLFVVRERHTQNPLIDLSLFRNLPFDLVTFLGSVCNISYGVVVVVVSLYLQQVRGLTPLQAGVVFLGLATLVAIAGPVGARLQPHFRPTLIMAFAGTTAGLAIISLTVVTSWWAFVPIFAICGFGLGLGWTFSNIATQEVVDPARAGEASGIVLKFLVTLGGIGLAAAASIISALERTGHSPRDAQETTLVIYALLSIAAAAIVMSIRAYLVRRGLMKPLSMAADRAAEPVPAATGGAAGGQDGTAG